MDNRRVVPAKHSVVMLDLTSRFCMRMAHLNPPRLQVTLVFSHPAGRAHVPLRVSLPVRQHNDNVECLHAYLPRRALCGGIHRHGYAWHLTPARMTCLPRNLRYYRRQFGEA
jgi:hypothetical protein